MVVSAFINQFCAKYMSGLKPFAHIRNILFDLDDTLWDFERNAEEALTDLFHRHHLERKTGQGHQVFLQHYQRINREYWSMYEQGLVDKHRLRTERFTEAFRAVGLPDEEHPERAWEEYLEICPLKTNLVEGARELLELLQGRYRMALVTNGFEQVQRTKIQVSDLDRYFSVMISSESCGHPKPAPNIFHAAMEALGADPSETLVIGDKLETDIQGAWAAGLSAIWYCPGTPIDATEHIAAHQVQHLLDIPPLLF
jgi:putative hydrolase of the HAD superfamily